MRVLELIAPALVAITAAGLPTHCRAQTPGLECAQLLKPLDDGAPLAVLLNAPAAKAIDPAQAEAACRAALGADPANPTLKFQVGRALSLAGKGREAMKFYLDAADRGHAGAINDVGGVFEYGIGVPKNLAGRKMRVDTTVVETNVHYPTDSSLLGDGVRDLIRTMKGIDKIAGEAGAKLCDRSRSVKLRVLDIARAARSRVQQGRERLKRAYGQLLNATSRVVGQAKRFSQAIADGTKRAKNVLKQLALEGLREKLDTMVPLVKQVMKQTRARIFRGDTRAEGKLLSVFEPSTEIIRKGKAAKPNEFGKMVKLQEAEDQIVIDYEATIGARAIRTC